MVSNPSVRVSKPGQKRCRRTIAFFTGGSKMTDSKEKQDIVTPKQEAPKRDDKLIVPFPPDQVKYDYPGKKELMKLLPAPKEPDPRGPSLLRNVWIPWKMFIDAESRLARFYHEYFSEEFVETLPALADDVWVLYTFNSNRFATGIDPARVFIELCHISYPLAFNSGFRGAEYEWADAVHDAGRTHRKRHRNDKNTEEK
jgi:hypothetical protein